MLQSDGRYLCALGSLAGGATRTVEFQATPGSGGTINTIVDLTSAQADPNPSDSTDTETTTVNAVGRDIAVTNTNNAGPGSLAQAIEDSNRDSGDVDRIVFNIPGGVQQTIALTSALPQIAVPTIIDGTTQPGFVNIPVIELNGAGIASSSHARAASDRRWHDHPRAGYQPLQRRRHPDFWSGRQRRHRQLHRPRVVGNRRPWQRRHGVAVSGSNNNLIGGSGLGNVISGNTLDGVRLNVGSTLNAVQGNYIGLDRFGNNGIPNKPACSSNAPGDADLHRITLRRRRQRHFGQRASGILMLNGATGTRVLRNIIGLDATGTFDLGNSGDGVRVAQLLGRHRWRQRRQRAERHLGQRPRRCRRGRHDDERDADRRELHRDQCGRDRRGRELGLRRDREWDRGNQTIGGLSAVPGNVISGNGSAASSIANATATVFVQGNLIGTDACGHAGGANNGNGISIAGVSNATIGGTARWPGTSSRGIRRTASR